MRRSLLVSLMAVPLGLGLLLPACGGGGGGSTASSGGSGGGGGTPSTCPIPSALAAPRFSTDILPALQSSCGSASTSCHGNANPPPGHIRYDTTGGRTATDVYNALINKAPASSPAGWVLVKPGDPAHSWLIEKITSANPGGGFGARMPLNAPDVCQATVDTFKAWIQSGAPF